MRPNPGPGTGPSSFLGRKHWQKPDHVIQYPAPGPPWQDHRRSDGKVLPFVDPKPKRTSGARAVHLPASVRWIGIPPWVWIPGGTHRALRWVGISGWGTASRTRERLSLFWERSAAKRSVPAVRRRRDQLPSLDGCPAAGVVSSGSLNGAQREKDLNTPTRWTGPGTRDLTPRQSGPRCLRRATSNPQRQHSLLGRPFQRANHPSGHTRATGTVPPGF